MFSLPVPKKDQVSSLSWAVRSLVSPRNAHHDLETIEAASLGDLDFTSEAVEVREGDVNFVVVDFSSTPRGGDEPLDQVLVDDAVRGGKEGQHVLDEVLLVILELRVPVVHVLGEILHA